MKSAAKKIKIVQRAPCRMDLAGGTVDLWPLYLYLGNLELVNMAIQVQATAEIEWTPAPKGKNRQNHRVHIESADMKSSATYESLDALKASLAKNTRENPLRWVNRVVHHALSQTKSSGGEWTVRTRSDAPPGSGLGGSSVLGVALSLGLARALNGKAPTNQARWEMQQQIRDLEAIEIEHPAGDQDYVPALFGGLLIFKLGPNSRAIEKLPARVAQKVGQHTALLYTGKPHHSGLNNWAIFKDFHDGVAGVRTSLARIRDISAQLAQALRDEDWTAVPELINQEWAERQRLSPVICPPVLDDAWSHAKSLGAIARKACGSGGGGCMLFYFPTRKAKELAVQSKLPRAEWKWLSTDPA